MNTVASLTSRHTVASLAGLSKNQLLRIVQADYGYAVALKLAMRPEYYTANRIRSMLLNWQDTE